MAMKRRSRIGAWRIQSVDACREEGLAGPPSSVPQRRAMEMEVACLGDGRDSAGVQAALKVPLGLRTEARRNQTKADDRVLEASTTCREVRPVRTQVGNVTTSSCPSWSPCEASHKDGELGNSALEGVVGGLLPVAASPSMQGFERCRNFERPVVRSAVFHRVGPNGNTLRGPTGGATGWAAASGVADCKPVPRRVMQTKAPPRNGIERYGVSIHHTGELMLSDRLEFPCWRARRG